MKKIDALFPCTPPEILNSFFPVYSSCDTHITHTHIAKHTIQLCNITYTHIHLVPHLTADKL